MKNEHIHIVCFGETHPFSLPHSTGYPFPSNFTCSLSKLTLWCWYVHGCRTMDRGMGNLLDAGCVSWKTNDVPFLSNHRLPTVPQLGGTS